MRINELTIKQLPFADNGQQRFRDDGLPGFGVLVGKRSKTFFVVHGRDRRTETLGRWPEVSVKEARLTAASVMSDPTPKKRHTSLPEARDAFLADCRRRLRPSTANRYYYALKDIDLTDTSVVDPTTLKCLKAFHNWCIQQGVSDRNPFAHRKVRFEARDRLLSDDEVTAIWAYKHPPYSDIVKLLILTGQRRKQIWQYRNRLHFPADLSGFKVNHTAIERSHKRFAVALQQAGGDPTTMPEVTIRYGHPDRLERRRDGSYVVYASRRTQNKRHQLNKTALWRNYRQALASAYLDGLATDQPGAHHQLRTQLDASHRDTTRLLVRNLAAASSPVERLGLSLQLRLWHRAPQRLQKKTSPESFGQVSFGTVNDWRREAVIVLAEAQRPGGWAGYAERQARAQRQLKSAITRRRNKIDNMGFGQRLSARLSGKRRRILREIMAKEAQLQAVDQLDHRLAVLRQHFPL